MVRQRPVGLGSFSGGFTLVETLFVLGLSLIALVVGLKSIESVSLELLDVNRIEALSSYNTELRSWIRKLDLSAQPLCLQKFNSPALTAVLDSTTLGKIVDFARSAAGDVSTSAVVAAPVAGTATASPVSTELDLGEINLLAHPDKRYGNFSIKNSSLDNFLLLRAYPGFHLAEPDEVSSLNVPNVDIKSADNLLYVLTANLNTYFETFSQASPNRTLEQLRGQKDAKKTVTKITLAIMKLGSGELKLIDCGSGTLARTTAVVDVCKALGPDFEFVIDKSYYQSGGGAATSGQCYLPLYEVDADSPAIGDEDAVAPITGYIPFRGFLCEPSKEGKSVDFEFCTGMK